MKKKRTRAAIIRQTSDPNASLKADDRKVGTIRLMPLSTEFTSDFGIFPSCLLVPLNERFRDSFFCPLTSHPDEIILTFCFILGLFAASMQAAKPA
jgi:hypothetical protein